MEDYLKAIYVLQRTEGAPVRTSGIAEYLGVTAPTVTSMVGNLAGRGLLVHEKYEGVELTEEGETVALEVIRHHRLLEAYLAEHLDYEWSEVHEEADALEHHISEAFEKRVADVLDDPAVDPHGDPIPDADLEPPEEDDTTPLSAHSAGERVTVARVSDRDEEELAYLSAAGLEPGTELVVVEHTPIETLRVTARGSEVTLPETVARSVRVRPATTDAQNE